MSDGWWYLKPYHPMNQHFLHDMDDLGVVLPSTPSMVKIVQHRSNSFNSNLPYPTCRCFAQAQFISSVKVFKFNCRPQKIPKY